LLHPIFTMMTKLSTTVKMIVTVMVVAALVAVSWESSNQQLESKRGLRVGKERKLQSLFPDFSAFGVPPSLSTSSFNPSTLSSPTTGGGNTGDLFGAGGLFGVGNGGNSGMMSPATEDNAKSGVASGNGDNSGMMSSPMGDNTEGGVASGFGDTFVTDTFFGTAGGSGGGVAQSSAGGSIKPISVGGVFQNQVTAFNATAGNTASGFGSGVVGPTVTSAFSGFGSP
jgi:hypothetical protein